MKMVRLGKTELMVSKVAFGVLPLQRVEKREAVRILQAALEGGINYFDTANAYTDSEEKIGAAFQGRRDRVILSTKSGGDDYATVRGHIEESLRRLKTDYIDLFQFHNPANPPEPDGEDGRYRAALEMQEKGYIRHIGITNHRADVALRAAESGLFTTMQFPFNYLASERDQQLRQRCQELDLGFIAMKALSGGLLSNARACYTFMEEYPQVVPIWGIQRMSELEEFLSLEREGAGMTEELRAVIEKDRRELAGNFCRGCGYCMPCPAGIEIFTAARMAMLLRRAPWQPLLSPENYEKMHRIENCIGCHHCSDHCPYGLDTPALLKEMLADYDAFYAEKMGK